MNCEHFKNSLATRHQYSQRAIRTGGCTIWPAPSRSCRTFFPAPRRLCRRPEPPDSILVAHWLHSEQPLPAGLRPFADTAAGTCRQDWFGPTTKRPCRPSEPSCHQLMATAATKAPFEKSGHRDTRQPPLDFISHQRQELQLSARGAVNAKALLLGRQPRAFSFGPFKGAYS